jgi:hypothetical protein
MLPEMFSGVDLTKQVESGACNPSRRLKQEDCKFKASLMYIVRLYFKKKNKAVQ